MFDNILDHPEIVEAFKEDIRNKKFPSSLLFYGDAYTGKLTAALELARVLSCGLDGEWKCTCSSCEQHRRLDSPSTVMLGNRYFLEEIAACASVLRRNRETTGRYQFIRAVRKLTRRFDRHIWEGEGNKLKGISVELEKIEEILEKIYPSIELPTPKKLDKLLSDAEKICEKIFGYISGDNIPLNHIRNITYWTHTTLITPVKVIIIEGADSMGESSRNALLKIIEEPPSLVYFILISSRKNKIIPTILSRVRPYNFRSRSDEQDINILKRIFRDDTDEYRNLRDYFMSMKGINLSILRQYANKLIDILINKNEIDIEEFSEVLNIIKENHVLKNFLEEMLFLLQKKFYKYFDKVSELPISVFDNWNRLIYKTMSNKLKYNQNTQLLFETLLYEMRSMI